MGDVSPFETLANSTWNTLSWSFGSRRRHCTDTVPPTLARDLPCDPKLAPSSHHFSHDAHIIADLAKHCYVAPRFVRRMKGSPKVPSSHRFSHTVRLGRRNSSVAGVRRWPTRVTVILNCGLPCLVDLPPFQPPANSIRNSVSWRFSFERRCSTETASDEVHETCRAIQSSRLVAVTFRTMST